MTKYKRQILEMMEMHQDVFKSFKEIHDKYALNPERWQEKFNQEGEKVLLIMKRWENNLCLKSESGKYRKFSSSLADKFWTEGKKLFPKIDYIGMQ